MEILYFIPARGGSKRLPKKNMMELSGKPLIAFSIEAAKNAEHRGRVVVSTDDLAIADISKKFGAEIVKRPDEHATDESPTIDAILHCLDALSRDGYKPDILVLLQPTSPLREPNDIDGAIETLFSSGAKSCISVCEPQHPPELFFTGDAQGFMNPLLGWKAFKSHSKNKVFVPNGAVYVVKVKDLLAEKKIYFENASVPYFMPRERSIDIDTILDFKFAEFLIEGKPNEDTHRK